MAEILIEPAEGAVCDHLVQVYRDHHELAESVATYLGAGFAAGEPAVAVVTDAHWPAITERLEAHGWKVSELEAEGRLRVANADETLAAICEAGTPSALAFNDVVGRLVSAAADRAQGRKVRVFGEMVDLLVRRDQVSDADVLESLWNELGARLDFTLLCGYRVDPFDRASQVALLPQVYRSHSHVLPRVDSEQLDAAIDSAFREVFGEEDTVKLYAQVAKHLHDERVSGAQRALMWASAHMPTAADRVLATMRASFSSAATPAV